MRRSFLVKIIALRAINLGGGVIFDDESPSSMKKIPLNIGGGVIFG